MIHRYNIIIVLLMLLMTTFATSCSESDDSIPEEAKKDANLLLSINTKAAADGLAKNGDSNFSNLIIYIFNKDDGHLEYSGSTIFYPDAPNEYSVSVNVSSKTKVIYAIANYLGSSSTLSTVLNSRTTMAELEAMTISSTGFTPTETFMIGKKEVEITGTQVRAEVPMERLAARIDIYMFKNQDLENNRVSIVSVELVNQITNSNAAYKNNTMLSPVGKATVPGVISANPVLTNMSSDLGVITPDNAHTSFYTYQNIAGPNAPDDNTPYLRAVINIDGTDYTYKGYLTDQGQTTNKYSLMRNTVYTVIAMFTHPDNLLILKIIPMPWTVNESQTGGSVTDADFSLDEWGGEEPGAHTGIIQFPFVVGGVALNETSYATYSFKLTAPLGKTWTATLTNGYDFTFGSEGTSVDIIPMSKGVSGETEYQIRVGARKYWDGTEKSTYMYITVDGTKLNINPVQASTGRRKYPGPNDTDILLTQTGFVQ